jgi:hypothetical protein
MIAGLSLPDLARKIVEDSRAKRDFKVNTARLTATATGTIQLSTATEAFDLTPTPYALRQVGEYTGIPAKYVDRMATAAPGLLATNLNHWFQAQAQNRLVRTYINGEQKLRALVSDKYRPLDYSDLAAHVLPRLIASGYVVKSAQVTDTRLYIQAITPALAAEIQERNKTDILHPGVVISNSEVGAGRLSIETLLYKLSCTNGAVFGSNLKKNHVGRAFDGGFSEDAEEYFSDETRKLDDAALWSKVNDVLTSSLDEAKFQALVSKVKGLTDLKLPAPIADVIETTAKNYGFSKEESESILNHFIDGGDTSQWGFVNAVTRTAEDAVNYDRAIEIEKIGGDLIAAFSKN